MRKEKLFVLYYHQMLPKWGFDKAYKTFDWELKFLKHNYRIITPDDIYEFLSHGRSPGKDAVCITFDDGFVDNYVYAYPLLKKHNVKATVFVPPSRITELDTVRPSLEDYWNNKVSFKQLHNPIPMGRAHRDYFANGKSEEFMSVAELHKISDYFQVECHAMVHARSFYEDNIIDFYDGHNGHYSDWYNYPGGPQLGYPIFPKRNTVSIREGKIKKEVLDFVKTKPSVFFSQTNWKEIIRKEISEQFPQRLHFETEAERVARVTSELKESKEKLSAMMGREINFFSYPFGDYDNTVANICSTLFKASFTVEKRSIKEDTELQKIPRGSVPKDFFSFLARIYKLKRS